MHHRSWFVPVVLVMVIGVGGLVAPPAAAQAEPDLSGVALDEGDLPPGYRLVLEDELVEAGGSAREIGEALEQSLQGARLQQYVVYASQSGEDLVEAVVVGPLAPTDRLGLELAMGDPASLADSLTPFIMFVDQSEPILLDTTSIGEASFGYTVEFTVTSDLAVATNILGVEWRRQSLGMVLGLRDDYLFVVAVSHLGGGEPEVDVTSMARHVDEHLATALGQGSTVAFRPEGTFSPGVITHIPGLADLSTDPGVIGANLVLAALAVIVLTVALRLLNTTLAIYEGSLETLLRPARTLRGWYERGDAVLRRRAGRWADAIRIAGILLFYGLAFSFLEDGWRPWTVSGLFVLFVMTVAFGLVGTGDDLVEFRAARRWGLPVRLAVRPALVVIATASVALTKVAGLVPGLMVGTPEAFTIDNPVDDITRFRLSRVQLLAMAGIGLMAWVVAAPLESALADAAGFGEGVLAALVTLLLLIFAVSVENLFAKLLGFPGSAGESLRQRSRAWWWVSLVLVTGLFFHTLVNPAGDLAESLRSTNVRVVMATVIVFLAVALGVRWWFRRTRPRSHSPDGSPHAGDRESVPA